MQRKTVVRRCQTVNVPARREYRLTRRFPLRAQDGLSDDGHRLTDGLSDGRGLMQAARCTASRCDRSVTAPACKPWAAPLVRPQRLWAVLRRLRALGLLALASRRSAAMGNRLRHAKSARKSLICMGPSRGRPIAGNSHRVVSLVDTNF